jgi:hypothetical protein
MHLLWKIKGNTEIRNEFAIFKILGFCHGAYHPDLYQGQKVIT